MIFAGFFLLISFIFFIPVASIILTTINILMVAQFTMAIALLWQYGNIHQIMTHE